MKKSVFVILLCCIIGFSSCETVGEGAMLGGMFGSAIGGIFGGPRGSNIGTLSGMLAGAAIGAAVQNQEEQPRVVRTKKVREVVETPRNTETYSNNETYDEVDNYNRRYQPRI